VIQGARQGGQRFRTESPQTESQRNSRFACYAVKVGELVTVEGRYDSDNMSQAWRIYRL
jgi:hypothetical protein